MFSLVSIAEIQGLYREVDETGAIRFYTYVVRE